MNTNNIPLFASLVRPYIFQLKSSEISIAHSTIVLIHAYRLLTNVFDETFLTLWLVCTYNIQYVSLQ